jgi:hypothetical protein
MNKLFLGINKQIELPESNFLYLHDDIPNIPRARVFDISHHSFNPLKHITYKKARELAQVLYTLYPQGENTLTVRNGKYDLLKALLTTTRLDKIDVSDEVNAMIADLLISPVLTHVLCRPTNFSFNPQSVILVRLNRAQIGDFDALALGLFLINHYPGQLVIPDFGFYARDAHAGLVRDNRLIAGINSLAELPLQLRKEMLLIKDKIPQGCLLEDAKTLAAYAHIPEATNAWHAFLEAAMV